MKCRIPRTWITCFIAGLFAVSLSPAMADSDVVVTDPGTGRAITGAMVARMLDADRRYAGLFGVPAPGSDAGAAMNEALRNRLMSWDAGIRLLLVDVDRNLPYAGPWLQNQSAGARARFIATMRPQIMGARTDGGRWVNLAAVLSGAGARYLATGGKNPGTSSALGGLLASQNRMQNSLTGAIRSGTAPCNTWNGAITEGTNESYCHPH